MTKRFLCLVLVMVMILSLCACNSNKNSSIPQNDETIITGNSNENTLPNTETGSNETDDANGSGKNTETGTVTSDVEEETDGTVNKKPENQVRPGKDNAVGTQNGTQKPSSDSIPQNNTSNKDNQSKPSNNQNSNSDKETSTSSVFKEFKFVEKKLANPYYTKNGQDLLTRLYGNDHTIQVGDSVTWEIILSSGSLDKWEITSYGGTHKLNGNKITVTANGSDEKLFVRVRLKDDSTVRYVSKEYDVITDAHGKITNSESTIEMELIRYAQRKGMLHTSGANIWGYVWNPTLNKKDANLSLTHNVDCGDDYIVIVGNSDWVDEAIELIDKYDEIGVIRVSFTVNLQGGFSTKADTVESAKYLK